MDVGGGSPCVADSSNPRRGHEGKTPLLYHWIARGVHRWNFEHGSPGSQFLFAATAALRFWWGFRPLNALECEDCMRGVPDRRAVSQHLALGGARELGLVMVDGGDCGGKARCNISNYSSYRLVTTGPLCAGLASRGITGGLLV